MAKYKYTGKTAQNLAGVGMVKPGDVITLSTSQALGVEKHAPDEFELIDDATPGTKNKAGEIPAAK